MPEKNIRIDTHHHIIPPALVAAMEARGLMQSMGRALPEWSPALSLAIMDAHDIGTAIVSLSAPGVYFGDRAAAADLARACNEYAAKMTTDHPGRFGFFAVLPMPFTDDSCAEACYAFDVLEADGVVLLGNTEGRFLGDPRFDELMAELNGRDAVVFLHPNLHPSTKMLGLTRMPGWLIEAPCDTTRATMNLILSGTLEKYPRIRWILSHAGGTVPYIAWRLALMDLLPEYSAKAPKGVMSYLRNCFYYDTALSPTSYALTPTREAAGLERIVFGSDYPFTPPEGVAMEVAALDEYTGCDAAAKAAIARGNVLKLFPRLSA